jgi:nucleoside-diphosphate-sugar epimerase
MTSILVTGANGFIGSSIVLKLATTEGNSVRAAVRRRSRHFPKAVEVVDQLEMSDTTDWRRALQDINVVVHCAARVHVIADKSNDMLEFRRVNTAGTLHLARQSASLGVKRFIFLSTLGVNGAETSCRPFKADDTPKPHSAYAQSKMEAELGLTELSRTTKMSIVIVRPPLVYGPNAPGNFGSLLRIVNRRIPLPLGAVRNSRSFVFVDNLVDMVIRCISHRNAVNQVFLVSDDEDLSTSALLRKVGSALAKPALLVPVPMYIVNIAARCVGKSKVARQLLGSLQVDIEKTKLLLDWSPPFTVDEALRRTVESR